MLGRCHCLCKHNCAAIKIELFSICSTALHVSRQRQQQQLRLLFAEAEDQIEMFDVRLWASHFRQRNVELLKVFRSAVSCVIELRAVIEPEIHFKAELMTRNPLHFDFSLSSSDSIPTDRSHCSRSHTWWHRALRAHTHRTPNCPLHRKTSVKSRNRIYSFRSVCSRTSISFACELFISSGVTGHTE